MSVVNAVRLGVPGAMFLAGIVLLFVGGDDAAAAGIVLIGSAALVAMAGALLRFSMGEERERDSEQAAREHYLEHGRWPGEEAEAEEAEGIAEPAKPHPGVRAVPGRARAARRKRPPRRP